MAKNNKIKKPIEYITDLRNIGTTGYESYVVPVKKYLLEMHEFNPKKPVHVRLEQ